MNYQRKIIVKNADGTTRIIQQSVPAAIPKQQQPQQTQQPQQIQQAQTQQSTPDSSAQKVQIIRGPDGKVSVRGLNPGQQLIQMPDGKLHVLTSNQTGDQRKTIIKTHVPTTKTIVATKSNIPQAPTPIKSPVVIRQQLPKSTTIVSKTVQKAPQTPQQQRVWFLKYNSCFSII